MSGFEIFLLFIGFMFVIISLFLIDGKKSRHYSEESGKPDFVFSEESIENAMNEVVNKLEDMTAGYVLDADHKLGSVMNEKMIAMNDFADPLLAKLNNNHQEVVFLYKMLQDKEEEMKSTLNRMEVIRKENQEFIEKIIALKNKKEKAKAEAEQQKKVQMQSKQEENIGSGQKSAGFDTVEKLVENTSRLDSDNKNKKILQLYKEKKSQLEISRMLGIGQGEVKLVIELYGKGSI